MQIECREQNSAYGFSLLKQTILFERYYMHRSINFTLQSDISLVPRPIQKSEPGNEAKSDMYSNLSAKIFDYSTGVEQLRLVKKV